jgi:outer membrane protein assembly factor BamB
MRTILNPIAAWIWCSVAFGTFAYAQQRPPVAPVPENCPPTGCPRDPEWRTYRFNNSRTGVQPWASNLSDPTKVGTLHCVWSFPWDGYCGQPHQQPTVGAFKASPIVVNDTVFIGNDNGFFYALDAATGALKWQYPKASDPALSGIQSSASYWDLSPNGAVIFGAQDFSLGPNGSARLFALDAKLGPDSVIWKSDPVAIIEANSGCSDPTKLRQIIHYSPPLIFDNKVYVGIQSTEAPVQVGRVVAVDLNAHTIVTNFEFQAVVGTPASPPGTVLGGGVWNAPATDGTGVYFTTGNVRTQNCPAPNPPNANPPTNNGLSMIRVDKDSGNIVWAFQPVPYELDDDPDWAAGATVMSTSCGELIASVQKDGWSYAVNAATGSCSWQFPPVNPPIADAPSCTGTGYSKFDRLGPRIHGDDDYRRPGAAWNDVFIVRTGGENLVPKTFRAGYSKLHALNACATTEKTRVRWIADLTQYRSGLIHNLSAPTVTGGIVFIGTDKGYLVVLGDPSVVPSSGVTCSNPDFPVIGPPPPPPLCRTCPQIRTLLGAEDCLRAGYAIVPVPTVLTAVQMTDGGSLVAIRNEPVLAKGRVFVGTMAGHVYTLEP